ncbi:MAG: cache domain-containing protein, partial [Anaerolineae bacterium]|nr:cache domain-containing protein [Anaerolineae bacterium]
MLQDVLIVQPDPAVAQAIANFFRDRGDRINHVKTLTDAKLHLTHNHPTLTIVDLHLFDNGEGNDLHSPWFNGSKVLFTSRYPVPDREAEFKEHGAITFLRQPFTRSRLEEALQTLNEANAPKVWDAQPLPKIKVPMRFKIIFPYVILALILAMVAAYLISQLVLDTIEERFTNQVIEMGKITSDWMVKEENELLATLRLLANTQGLAAAVGSEDAETLRRMTLPSAINYGEESIEILNNQGVSILSMRQQPGGNLEDYNFSRGDDLFPEWTFVDNVLQQQFDDNGDKFAGVGEAPWGRYFYVAGPVFDGAGKQVGTILIGKSLQTLVRQIRQDTLAHTTIYDFDGQPLVSTLPAFQDSLEMVDNAQMEQIIGRQNTDSLIRPIAVSSVRYSEILGPWEARSGE